MSTAYLFRGKTFLKKDKVGDFFAAMTELMSRQLAYLLPIKHLIGSLA